MHTTVNLLPDSKQQRIDEKRLRRLMISIATVVSAVAVGVPIILLLIKGGQTIALNRTQDQINERKTQIQNTANITTMLSVKDHMNTLPSLYAQRTYLSRLLDVMPKVLPKSIRLSNLDIDSSGVITIKGVSATYAEVERVYKKILIYNTKYDRNRVEEDHDQTGLFTKVVTQEVTGPSGNEVTFTISSNFDAAFIIGALTEGANNEAQ